MGEVLTLSRTYYKPKNLQGESVNLARKSVVLARCSPRPSGRCAARVGRRLHALSLQVACLWRDQRRQRSREQGRRAVGSPVGPSLSSVHGMDAAGAEGCARGWNLRYSRDLLLRRAALSWLSGLVAEKTTSSMVAAAFTWLRVIISALPKM